MGTIHKGTTPYKKVFHGLTEYSCVYHGLNKVWCNGDVIIYTPPPVVGTDMVGSAPLLFSSGSWSFTGNSPTTFEIIGTHPAWMSVDSNGNLVGVMPNNVYQIYAVKVRATKGIEIQDSVLIRVGRIHKYSRWRMHITGNWSATNGKVSLSTLRVFDVHGTDLLQNGILRNFVDHGSSAGEGINNLIDNNGMTNWASNGNNHTTIIEMNFSRDVAPVAVEMIARNDAYFDSGPKAFSMDYYAIGNWKYRWDFYIRPAFTIGSSRRVEQNP